LSKCKHLGVLHLSDEIGLDIALLLNMQLDDEKNSERISMIERLYALGIFSLLVSLGLPLEGAIPELPSTPAGKVLAGYLDALNSGDKEKLQGFVKTHRPDRPDALDRMLNLRWNTGAFDLYSIESSQPLNIQAVLREREGNENYERMTVTVSDGEPAIITQISLAVITPPAGAPIPQRLAEPAAIEAWKAELDKATSAGRFSGVWLWAKNGKVIASAPEARRIAREESTTRSRHDSASVR
jgi:hypothetical protein